MLDFGDLAARSDRTVSICERLAIIIYSSEK